MRNGRRRSLTAVPLAVVDAAVAAASPLVVSVHGQTGSVPNSTPETAIGPIQGDTFVQGSFSGNNVSSEYWYFYTAAPNAVVNLQLEVNTQTMTCGDPLGCQDSMFTATIIAPDGTRLQTVDASRNPGALGQYTLPTDCWSIDQGPPPLRGRCVTDVLSALSQRDAVTIRNSAFGFGLTFAPNHVFTSVRAVVQGTYRGSGASGTIAVTDHSRHHGVCANLAPVTGRQPPGKAVAYREP